MHNLPNVLSTPINSANGYMKSILLFYMGIICLLASCDGNPSSAISRPVTLLFSSVKSNYDTLYFEQGATMAVRKPRLMANLSYLRTDCPSLTDTVSVEVESDYIVLSHRYAPLSAFCYMLEAGDSVQFDYADGIPLATVLNREVKPYDINYDCLKRKRYRLTCGLRTEDVLKQPAVLMFLEPGKYRDIAQAREEYAERWQAELADENAWLDSLQNAGLISESYYRLYKERNYFTRTLQNVGNLSEDSLSVELAAYNDTTYRQDIAGFYRGYFNVLAQMYLNAHYPQWGNSQENLLKAYDDMESNDIIPGALGEYIRKILLPHLVRLCPFEQRREYIRRFAASAVDTAFVYEMQQKYVTTVCRETVMPLADSLKLTAVDGSHTTLGNLLRQWKDKAVYVDFWSSTCGPCLQAMPQSEALREDTASQGVMFLYLSMDNKDSAWRGALGRARLKDYPHSYRVETHVPSAFLKHYAVDWLPRYMLFDKDKNLWAADAPGPDEARLKELLEVAGN